MPIVGPNSIIPCQPIINGGLAPCEETLTYEQGVFNVVNNTFSNKVSGGNPATLVNSNAAYFNGTSSKIVCTYTNDILYYLDRLQIYYSLNGTTALLWKTGDAAVSGLFQIDLANKTLTLGYNGTNYFTGWIWIANPQYLNGVDYIDIQHFTFASGLTTQEENRSVTESEWVDVQYPFGDVLDLAVTGDLKFI